MSNKDKFNIISILEAIEKIFEYSKDYSNAEDFINSKRDFDASMMNFVVIGEMVCRLSDKFIEDHNQINWQQIKGFRNIVAHNYFGIDAEEVWAIIKKHLPNLKNNLANTGSSDIG